MKHLLFVALLFPVFVIAQKKPLDHSVYDSWESIGEKNISNDGRWVIYTIIPQEGDGNLFIQSALDQQKIQVPRGYNAVFSADSRFVVYKIRPLYRDTRDARIKKKRPEDFPRDSMGILELQTGKIIRFPKIRSFKMPEKGGAWMAYQKEKDPAPARSSPVTQKTVDSLRKKLDSLSMLVMQLKNEKAGKGDNWDAEDDPVTGSGAIEGSDVVFRNLADGKERSFKNVADFNINIYGQKLLMRIMKAPGDSAGVQSVILYDVASGKLDTILKGGNDFKNFTLSEDGSRVAFVAERDTAIKALQKFYGLYLFSSGDDSAHLIADKKTVGMDLGYTVSENGAVVFSKTGNRILFGTVPISPVRDTTLVDMDLVKLDIWNYKDDYLMTQQLFQLNNELRRNYLAVYSVGRNEITQLGSTGLPTIIQTDNGDGDFFIGITDTGRRVESQWTGATKKDVYAVNATNGNRILVRKNLEGQVYPSSTGRYILLYDNKTRNYQVWNGKTLKNISSAIKVPLYNEENDIPNDPAPYGVMTWHEKDSFVYVYDKYDVWRLDPEGLKSPVNLTAGRPRKIIFRYQRLDNDERFIRAGQQLFFKVVHDPSKKSGFVSGTAAKVDMNYMVPLEDYAYNGLQKAKSADAFIYTKESYQLSPDIYLMANGKYHAGTSTDHENKSVRIQLSHLNPQQSTYNWGTAELYQWKAFDGKPALGILYKPEDFDSSKIYPVLIYFYEELTDGLNNYIPPAPTPSRLNIPFFVSRGYLVFAPDIHYTKGHPGKDAYNYIVSGARSLSKKKWVDAKNMGLQGQSWGGYQVAYLITATNMFKAAWAGAPVVNMFSAYGGIRWESGNNRQFQYEKGQSRIGYTPWQRPDLYIENSPFFHLQQVTTPLVIMSNDADGAVPWYQGIEFFTAMRRLNKKVWLLNYNGEAHNLVERRNRKDIQIREQEYFDWQLKGAKPARWLVDGVPAVRKGKDWGLELVDGKVE